jgi:hypothetical protein
MVGEVLRFILGNGKSERKRREKIQWNPILYFDWLTRIFLAGIVLPIYYCLT